MQMMTTEVIKHGRIRTTYGKALATCDFVDRMIVLAKRGDDLSRREAEEWMMDRKLVENLFKLAPNRYPDQNADFCTVTRTMQSKGQAKAKLAYIELN